MKRASKPHINNIFGTFQRVKVKLPGHHESDVQLIKRQFAHATTAISTATTTTTNTTLTLQLLVLTPELL